MSEEETFNILRRPPHIEVMEKLLAIDIDPANEFLTCNEMNIKFKEAIETSYYTVEDFLTKVIDLLQSTNYWGDSYTWLLYAKMNVRFQSYDTYQELTK